MVQAQAPGFGSSNPDRRWPAAGNGTGSNRSASAGGHGGRGEPSGNGSGDFWDQESLIGDVPKNARGEVIRVKRVTKRGRTYVDVRTFYPGNDGQLRPGKGISLPDNLLEAVLQLLKQAAYAAPESVSAASAASAKDGQVPTAP